MVTIFPFKGRFTLETYALKGFNEYFYRYFQCTICYPFKAYAFVIFSIL